MVFGAVFGVWYNVTFALQAINMIAVIPTPLAPPTTSYQGHSGTHRKNVWSGSPSQQDDKIQAANDSLQQEEDQLKHS